MSTLPQLSTAERGPEHDAMVAALLGITPDRLRTMRRVQSKRAQCGEPIAGAPARAERARWWQHVDQLGDDELCDALRRREVRARIGVGRLRSVRR